MAVPLHTTAEPIGPTRTEPDVIDLRRDGLGAMQAFADEDPESPPDVPFGSASALTYERYFGLREKPFSLSTDPRFLYRSDAHTPVLRDLTAAIRRREGLIVLTGDIGTGKTTLCRAVLSQLDRKTFATFVPDPFGTREDLLKTMLVEFGAMSVEDLVKGRLKGASRPDLSYPLYEFLRSLHPLDAFAVLVVDEVQNLSVPLLEEVRILADLEDRGRKLLQVVLVGQPEFDEQLRLPRLRQVRQRVTVHFRLQALSADDTAGYVAHRLFAAGVTSAQVRFTDDALDLVHRATQGVPRAINILCDRAMAVAEAAHTSRIDPRCVTSAVAELSWAGLAPVDDVAPQGAAGGRVLHETAPGSPVAPAPSSPELDRPGVDPLQAALVDAAELSAIRGHGSAVPRSSEPVSAPTQGRGPLELERNSQSLTPELAALLDLPPTPLAVDDDTPPRTTAQPGRRGTDRVRKWRRPVAPLSLRPVAVAALMAVGALTGLSAMTYWWLLRPLYVDSGLPAVARPAILLSSLGPLNLRQRQPDAGPARGAPTIEPEPPEDAAVRSPAPAPVEASGASVPVNPVTWVVQLGAFADHARATTLAASLTSLGFTTFEDTVATASGTRLRAVFVGPFDDRAAALATLTRLRERPELEQAVVRRAPR